MGMIELPLPEQTLPGRNQPLSVDARHFVSGRDMREVPENAVVVLLGMGCFWGAERKMWSLGDVHSTAVGYAGGTTPNPTYEEVCSGRTGHTEVVRVVCPPSALFAVFRTFWESHDPTQGMRQGNDRGTQYRSAIYSDAEQVLVEARRLRDAVQPQLSERGLGPITTEIRSGLLFYFAEGYHQQYLAKNPNGYCGLRGTGVSLEEC